MSVKVMGLVFDGFREGGRRKVAMLALADHAHDDGGRIYPSMRSLARKICCTERQARRIVKQLLAEGWLQAVEISRGGSPRRTSVYRMDLNKLRLGIEDDTTTPDMGVRGRADTGVRGQTPDMGVTPDMGAQNPGHPDVRTPDIWVSGEPSLTKRTTTDARAREGVLFRGGGGGGSAAPGGAEPEAKTPAGNLQLGRTESGPLARIGPPMPADEHRRQVTIEAMITAGIDDPRTRVRLAALPHVTAALVRLVAREAKASRKGPGVMVSMIETASARITLEQEGKAEAQAVPSASPMAERSTRELERIRDSARDAMIEDNMALLAIDSVTSEQAEQAKADLLHERPELRYLTRYEPRESRLLRALIIDRLGVDAEQHRAEATRLVDERFA